MRCSSCCAATSYDLTQITSFYKKQHFQVEKFQDKVLHIKIPTEPCNDFFVFFHGCFVLWGKQFFKPIPEIVSDLKNFATGNLKDIETNQFIVVYKPTTEIFAHKNYTSDVIALESDESKIKLAISYGLAQSIKLEAFERLTEYVINKNSTLANDLANSGTIPLSTKEISKRIGEIFSVRNLVNLSSEYLEMPEYFWEHSDIENYYKMSEKFLDLQRRVAALNQKTDLLHEFLNMMNNQLQHKQSNLLEFTIIILIFIEIIMSIVYYFIR